MFGKKTLVTAAIAATALMSPAAVLASGGATGSGGNSKSKSTSTAPAPPAECATITNATTTQGPLFNMVTGAFDTTRYLVEEHAQANNCGTQTESLVWDISWTNTKTGVVEYPSVYNLPADVAPGGSLDMAVYDAVTDTVPGKSYRFDLSVKSATTGKILAQQSVYYTIR
jgi:hypothetical protein